MEVNKIKQYIKIIVSPPYAAMTSVRTNSKIKEGSNLFICIINFEFHFTTFTLFNFFTR